ncbi:hypothetical protein YC2023_036855 [Brassica napus]
MELVAHAGNSTTTIPVDLIVEILSLLPSKSIIRFQSVSKQWFSIIRSKDLVDTFLTRSKTRPHLLLVLELFTPAKRFLFSVPEHKTNDPFDRQLLLLLLSSCQRLYLLHMYSLQENSGILREKIRMERIRRRDRRERRWRTPEGERDRRRGRREK